MYLKCINSLFIIKEIRLVVFSVGFFVQQIPERSEKNTFASHQLHSASKSELEKNYGAESRKEKQSRKKTKTRHRRQ